MIIEYIHIISGVTCLNIKVTENKIERANILKKNIDLEVVSTKK